MCLYLTGLTLLTRVVPLLLQSIPSTLVLTCVVAQGLAGIVGNPVLSQAIAGLATSATAQATLERVMLFDLKDKIVEPFGETAQQVFARISAMRDSLDGPQVVKPIDCAPKCFSCVTQSTFCFVHNL